MLGEMLTRHSARRYVVKSFGNSPHLGEEHNPHEQFSRRSILPTGNLATLACHVTVVAAMTAMPERQHSL
jgi:hypothetical protein